jgi:hypothetical protein
MAMLGLKTLPVNHRLHRFYRFTAAVVGLLLVVLGILGFVVSGKVLGVPLSTQFSAVLVVAGLIMIGAAIIDGNTAAEINAYTGAGLILLGMAGLLTMHTTSANFLDVSMADLTILFVAGMAALAAGFYGRVSDPATH